MCARWNSGVNGAAVEAIADHFNATVGAEKGIVVKAVYQGNDNSEKLKTLAQASDFANFPDVAMIAGAGIPSAVTYDSLVPVGTLIDREGNSISRDDLEPNMLRSYTYENQLVGMPFSCSDPLIVAETIKQMYEKYPEFTSIYEDSYNQKFVGIGVSDPYGFFSTKEVKSLEDVNGMKIGAAGINLSWIEGSGAVGVQTSLNDTYQNLQTNVCQATIQPTHSCVNLKVYEVAPYYLDANFNVVPFNAITVNMDTWNDLPEDVQNIISEVGEGYLDYESEYINTIHEEDIKALEEQGCTVTTLSREEQEKWAASLPDVVNGLVKSLDDAGYNGSEIVEDYYEILESQGVERVRDWKISE